MSVANIMGTVVTQSSYQRARASVANMQGGNLNAVGVLSAIQQLIPGTGVSANTQAFNGSGQSNLGIHPAMLRKAANDPEEMVRLKALSLDIHEMQSSSIRGLESRGITVYASGTIIHADGTSSGWTITRSPDLREQRRESRAIFELDDRPSQVELMRQHLEEINATRSWTA
ncbi:MAG: hypothetical protein FWB96_04310 [Defluviitaleaceae bacterium]|nr:hypothetical protein [Defluviitaleaceae bacterium]MCL2262921.1 hypothetical protein [Defluviitaleaceae bacterium]